MTKDNKHYPLARSGSHADKLAAEPEIKKPDFTPEQEAFAQAYIDELKDSKCDPGKWEDKDILKAMSLAPVIFYLAMDKKRYNNEDRVRIASGLEQIGGQYKLRSLGPDVEIEINMEPLVRALRAERLYKTTATALITAIVVLEGLANELAQGMPHPTKRNLPHGKAADRLTQPDSHLVRRRGAKDPDPSSGKPGRAK